MSCDGKQPIVFHMIFSYITVYILGCFICNCNMNAIFLQSWDRSAEGLLDRGCMCSVQSTALRAAVVQGTYWLEKPRPVAFKCFRSPWLMTEADISSETSVNVYASQQPTRWVFAREFFRCCSRDVFVMSRKTLRRWMLTFILWRCEYDIKNVGHDTSSMPSLFLCEL